ncbi:MAG: translocase [Methanobacteriota archaeon]|nr:MAG: translocase [Euryarchaeota archaeon]HIN04472.1 twin-arginine translocase TatA/TatE family subunit [Candidatus Poseidoniales archaeon]
MAFGTTEIAILVILAIFVFGAKKIPELARNVGRAKGEFQQGLQEGLSDSSSESDMDRGGMTEAVADESE